MSTIDLKDLSAAQKLELMKQLEAEEKAHRQSIKEDRETYKKIVDETTQRVFDTLRQTSSHIQKVKTHIYDSYADIIELKADVYGDRVNDQYSNTFTTSDGKLRIKLGNHVTDDYDDTVNVGIEKVRNYISSLARNKESKQLVDAVLRLLSRNKEGKLHASRVVQLSKMADESGDPSFIDGVKIIRDAHQPTRSKNYIQAWYRNDVKNEWESLPLSITEA